MTNVIHKILVFVFFNIFFCTGAVALSFDEKYVEGGITYNSDIGFTPSFLSGYALYSMVNENFEIIAATKASVKDVQLTGVFIFFPYIKENLKLGVDASCNIDWYLGISLANHLLAGGVLQWSPCWWYKNNFDFNFMLKERTIFSIADTIPLLWNYSFAISLLHTFFIGNGFYLKHCIATYEMFRHMILCAPTFSFAVGYCLKDKWFLETCLNIRYTDFFTLSAYYEDSEININVRYKF